MTLPNRRGGLRRRGSSAARLTAEAILDPAITPLAFRVLAFLLLPEHDGELVTVAEVGNWIPGPDREATMAALACLHDAGYVLIEHHPFLNEDVIAEVGA